MFFVYHQNNSGGSFEVNNDVGHEVIIEADTMLEANFKAQQIGIYFNGIAAGYDCDCCGDRWYDHPSRYDKCPTPESFVHELSFNHVERIVYYFDDGRKEVHDLDVKAIQEEAEKERLKDVKPLWVSFIYNSGSYTEPVELWPAKFNDTSWWHKGGNLGGELILTQKGKPKTGFHTNQHGFDYYAHWDKSKVEAFVAKRQKALTEDLAKVKPGGVAHTLLKDILTPVEIPDDF